MKAIILLLLGSTLAIIKADDSADKAQIAQHVARDADTLRELLSENWVVKAKDNEITLTSKFEVFILGLVSRNDVAPEFSDKTPRKKLLEETQPEKYVICLHYEKTMLPEEYARRRQERQKAAMSTGSKTKDEATAWAERFESIKLPRYRDMYDIYEKLPYWGHGALTYPPRALQKVGGAKEILAAVLHQVITDID